MGRINNSIMFDTPEEYQIELELLKRDWNAWKNALEHTKQEYIKKYGAEAWELLLLSIKVTNLDINVEKI